MSQNAFLRLVFDDVDCIHYRDGPHAWMLVTARMAMRDLIDDRNVLDTEVLTLRELENSAIDSAKVGLCHGSTVARRASPDHFPTDFT